MKSPDQPRPRRGIGARMEAAGRKRFGGRQSRRPTLESLERRALLTTITEYPTSPTTVQPTAMITGSGGNIWFLEAALMRSARLTRERI